MLAGETTAGPEAGQPASHRPLLGRPVHPHPIDEEFIRHAEEQLIPTPVE
jgi:hypothetical protein